MSTRCHQLSPGLQISSSGMKPKKGASRMPEMTVRRLVRSRSRTKRRYSSSASGVAVPPSGAPARSVKSGQLSTRFFRDSMAVVTWSSAARSSSTVASSPRLRSTGSGSGKVFSHPSSSPRVTPAFWRVASSVASSAVLKERNVPSGKKSPSAIAKDLHFPVMVTETRRPCPERARGVQIICVLH